jgi:hypothetical protein
MPRARRGRSYRFLDVFFELFLVVFLDAFLAIVKNHLLSYAHNVRPRKMCVNGFLLLRQDSHALHVAGCALQLEENNTRRATCNIQLCA